MANNPSLYLRSAKHFREHPDSVAERLRQMSVARTLRALSRASGTGPTRRRPRPETPAPERTSTRRIQVASCPLGDAWTRWDMFGPVANDFRLVPPEGRVRCDDARGCVPRRHRGRLKMRWSAATPLTHGERPDHMHADVTVDGLVVHIDCVHRNLGGPGRAVQEVRIFVDGVLEGRGGSAGCSLGFGGDDLPAVARVGSGQAVTVDLVAGIPAPVVELWEIAATRESTDG